VSPRAASFVLEVARVGLVVSSTCLSSTCLSSTCLSSARLSLTGISLMFVALVIFVVLASLAKSVYLNVFVPAFYVTDHKQGDGALKVLFAIRSHGFFSSFYRFGSTLAALHHRQISEVNSRDQPSRMYFYTYLYTNLVQWDRICTPTGGA
jgi:hypothetical protein